MKTNIKYILGLFFAISLTLVSCSEETYSLGDLKEPSNIVINAEVVGKDATHPDGDGSGLVKFSISADKAVSYKIDYDASTAEDFILVPTGRVDRKYTKLGVNTYRVTALIYGAGGTSSVVTKDVKVRCDFTPDPAIITALTNNGTKKWVIDKSTPGHLGVGPYDVNSIRPQWWSAGVDEKVGSANCLYTATFTFSKIAATGTYELKVATPSGAFTKTGALTSLPGIPASGAEGCYDYSGGTSGLSFMPASSGALAVPTNADNSPSTQVSFELSGVNTFIGYGAVQKEYEILAITADYLYLRVQGTETGNAWYMKLKPAL
jgi:hypothetical protein